MRLSGCNRRNVSWISGLAVLLAGCLLCFQSGCGGGGTDGPARYGLSGTVTYDGKPVPFGQMIFSPDTAAGNSGPQGFAEIRDGKYQTAEGKGTVGGPHVVQITGFGSDPATGSEDNPVPPLFSEYQTKADLPKEDATMDFEVPASN